MIEFREISTDEINEIQVLANSIWIPTFKSILSDEQITYMMEMMYSTDSLTEQINMLGHQFVILSFDKKNVGYTSYEINYNNTPTTKIHKLYVSQDIQGKGLGSKAINYVAEQALKNKNDRLTLNVNRYNSALDFYLKNGFKIVKEENIKIGNQFLMEDYQMEKHLLK